MAPRIPLLNKLMNAGQQALSEPMPMRPAMTGWNTRDDLDGMDPTDAITMDNWYADAGGLLTRKGSVPYATGLTGQCETIAEYFSGTNHKLIACHATRVGSCLAR